MGRSGVAAAEDVYIQLSFRIKIIDTIEFSYYESKYIVREWWVYDDYMVGPNDHESWYQDPDISTQRELLNSREVGLVPIEEVPFDLR